MKVPKVPRFLKKKYTLLIIALLVIGSGTVVAISQTSRPTSTLKPTSQSQSLSGSSTSSSNSPSTSSSSGSSTTPGPSGNPAQAAQQQQANNEAEDQSLMDQNSNNTTPTSNSPAPNPSQCSTIEAQEQAATASLVTQVKQLNAAIQSATESLWSVNNPEGYTGQAAATIEAGIQNEENEINADESQINSIEAPYSEQLGYNECT